jgi:hypothetical protein
MMERIMTLDNYKYDQLYGYNSTFIVQLVENFRSHPSIFEFSNEEFYNSRLVSRQKEEIANFAIGWNLLPNKNYPVIFQENWSESEQKMKGTSMFNQGELKIVEKYVTALLYDGINGKKVEPSDIGIISPYAAQNEKLKEMFTNGIEIGTVEYFQGREKLVIIVSCVRSQTKTVGFLSNQKRLNVSLTRAKALQIIIGNPETLRMDKYWRKFIELCEQKNAVISETPIQFEKNMRHLSLDLSEMVMAKIESQRKERRKINQTSMQSRALTVSGSSDQLTGAFRQPRLSSAGGNEHPLTSSLQKSNWRQPPSTANQSWRRPQLPLTASQSWRRPQPPSTANQSWRRPPSHSSQSWRRPAVRSPSPDDDSNDLIEF